ncbi:MAG: hypothetical protein HQ538_03580 [Parcubacteria group bacterium]|nr:hypothetical protein [Parcubacteria group bacterium]
MKRIGCIFLAVLDRIIPGTKLYFRWWWQLRVLLDERGSILPRDVERFLENPHGIRPEEYFFVEVDPSMEFEEWIDRIPDCLVVTDGGHGTDYQLPQIGGEGSNPFGMYVALVQLEGLLTDDEIESQLYEEGFELAPLGACLAVAAQHPEEMDRGRFVYLPLDRQTYGHCIMTNRLLTNIGIRGKGGIHIFPPKSCRFKNPRVAAVRRNTQDLTTSAAA